MRLGPQGLGSRQAVSKKMTGPTPWPADAQIAKRSVTIAGHATSVSLEAAFWEALKDIAGARGISVNALIGEIDRNRDTDPDGRPGNLSSALRVFVLRNT